MRHSALLLLVFVLTGCFKEPVADFSTDKATYYPGETIRLTNESTDAHSYIWRMPDGQTASSRNLDYTLNQSSIPSIYTFTLEAFSKRGNKSDVINRFVEVLPNTGEVTFWQHPNCGCGVTTVTLSNGHSQDITYNFNGAPNCGTFGAANFTLQQGNYSFNATDGVWYWSGSITIIPGSCLTKELI